MVAWDLMKIGLVGLPKSGKTTLFNLLTGQSVATSSFGATRGEMHVGVARVPDARVDRLSAIFQPKKTTYAEIRFTDFPASQSQEKLKANAALLAQSAADRTPAARSRAAHSGWPVCS